jgi:hypothetical protein
MKLRMITVAVLVALMGMLVAPLQTSAKPKPKNPVPVEVSDGTFTGQFNLERLEPITNEDGTPGIAAVGDLLGADGTMVKENFAWPVDLAATQAANASAAVAGDVNAQVTCDILELVLAPLHLDLLGLVVDLSQVILTITGETGALLGDLLCGLLGGIDLLGTLLGLLDQINAILDGGALGALTGLLAIVGGLFLLDNFINTGDAILASGTISDADGTDEVLPASGPVDLAATRAATAPAVAGNINALATCEILNLVLGPLHLDLLGLVVDLNQVTLNITAEQAPGNLLGNLLCAVANLLNGPSPLGGLTGLLNNILRVLGRA